MIGALILEYWAAFEVDGLCLVGAVRLWDDTCRRIGASEKYLRTTGLERCDKSGANTEVHSLLVA